MGPEHPMDDSQVGVSYIEFSDLKDPGVVDSATLTSLAISEDWKHHYECLNLLRALNKYHRDYLLSEEVLCGKLGVQFVKEQIDNLRSNLSKCALMLIKEVF